MCWVHGVQLRPLPLEGSKDHQIHLVFLLCLINLSYACILVVYDSFQVI